MCIYRAARVERHFKLLAPLWDVFRLCRPFVLHAYSSSLNFLIRCVIRINWE